MEQLEPLRGIGAADIHDMNNLLRLDGLKDYLFGGSARKSRRRTRKDNAAGQTRSMHRLRKSHYGKHTRRLAWGADERAVDV